MKNTKSIKIIGAGISGLSAALALKTKGINYEIYEQNAEISYQNVGLGISSNVFPILEKWGILNDAGMTELIRPALYQAFHYIENLTSLVDVNERYDIVGPICESSDCFGKALLLATTIRGDLIAVNSCGAYGEVMASQYNLRTLPRSIY